VSAEREAMGDLLSSVPWEVYCTWQFRSTISPEGALREVRWWLGCLRFAFSGPRRLGWMIGIEHDLGAEWCHAHGLVVTLGDQGLGEEVSLYAGRPHAKTVPFIEPFWLAWQRRHGGGYFKIIEGDAVGPSFYCSKYAAKRGDIQFSPGLECFRAGAGSSGVALFPSVARVGVES
jgi:hypothetical protein